LKVKETALKFLVNVGVGIKVEQWLGVQGYYFVALGGFIAET